MFTDNIRDERTVTDITRLTNSPGSKWLALGTIEVCRERKVYSSKYMMTPSILEERERLGLPVDDDDVKTEEDNLSQIGRFPHNINTPNVKLSTPSCDPSCKTLGMCQVVASRRLDYRSVIWT